MALQRRLGIIEVVRLEADETNIESKFNTLVSVRDIVRLLNKFLKDAQYKKLPLVALQTITINKRV